MSITKISPDVVDFDAGITISTADNTDTLTLTSTDADDNSGPNLNMYRNSSSAADADVLGQIKFTGKNDAGSPEDIVYGSISGKITDASDGTEDGNLRFFTMEAGTSTETLTLSSSNVGAGTTAPLLRLTSVDSGTGGASTSGNVGVTHGNANILIGGHNESNSATYSGIALETRTSGASRWLIANEWQSTYLGDLVFHRRTGGTASAEALRITNAGNLKMPSGQGIDFSATSNGSGTSSVSELLDDYEEGTWTPAIAAGGWSINTTPSATYTKIGRAVNIQCYTSITGTGNSTALKLSGLPFNSASNHFAVSKLDAELVNTHGAYVRTDAGTDDMLFLTSEESTSTGRTTLAGNEFGAGYLIFSFTYFV